MAEIVPRRPTVVAALPLKEPARQRLAELLGARVADVRDVIEAPELVITPPCSPTLLGRLKERYGGARVVVVELTDDLFDIDLGGPVQRLLTSGADAYVVADSLEDLATRLTGPPPADGAPGDTSPLELPDATAAVDDLLTVYLDQAAASQPTRRH